MSIGIDGAVGLLGLAGILTSNERLVGIALTLLATLVFFAFWIDGRNAAQNVWPDRPGPRFGVDKGERGIRALVIGLVPLAGLWAHFFVNAGHIASSDAKLSIVWASIALTAAGAMLLALAFDPDSVDEAPR